jgi:hypothetical protein
VFSNGSFKEPLLNGYATFLGLTFIFLLRPIIFAPTDCPSHRSLIPTQCSKNKKFKTLWITNPFLSVFIYKKKDERETERERRKKEERRGTKEIKIETRPSQI